MELRELFVWRPKPANPHSVTGFTISRAWRAKTSSSRSARATSSSTGQARRPRRTPGPICGSRRVGSAATENKFSVGCLAAASCPRVDTDAAVDRWGPEVESAAVGANPAQSNFYADDAGGSGGADPATGSGEAPAAEVPRTFLTLVRAIDSMWRWFRFPTRSVVMPMTTTNGLTDSSISVEGVDRRFPYQSYTNLADRSSVGSWAIELDIAGRVLATWSELLGGTPKSGKISRASFWKERLRV